MPSDTNRSSGIDDALDRIGRSLMIYMADWQLTNEDKATPAEALLALGAEIALAAFCSALPCSDAIGEACLRALPVSEASPEELAWLILADLSTSACGGVTSVVALRRSLKERSQGDFGRGRIVNVDGWMLSLTETRIYAFSALLARKCSPRSHQIATSKPTRI